MTQARRAVADGAGDGWRMRPARIVVLGPRRTSCSLLLPWGCCVACLSLLPQSPSLPAGLSIAPPAPRVASCGQQAPQRQSLRGGSTLDTFGHDVEGGDVVSALADPEMTKVRAFMPRELRRKFTFDAVFLTSKCWLYPLPPWGRKDVYQAESRCLQIWNFVMCLAVFYVAAVEPFRAAGFVPAVWPNLAG